MKHIFHLFILSLFIACSGNKPEISSDSDLSSYDSLIGSHGLALDKLIMPAGFSINVYGRVDNARSMAMGTKGTLFVSNRNGNSVYALVDTNGDFKADKRFVIASGLKMPNGVAFKDGSLYVAEIDKLWRFDEIENNLENVPTPTLIYEDYPADRHHGWKYIAFGPDGKLYVPVGAPCNICESKDAIYASITRMDPDGSNREIYASGVRNTVGFTWHPVTGELWFTDNGRDLLGDEIPPCELNRVTQIGQHFGYPYCHGGDIKDPEFGDKRPCSDFIKPAQKLNPHVAPLGLKFYTGSMFPIQYQNKVIIAEHGSWNRSPEAGHTGHVLSIVSEENGVGTSYETFISGFLNKETNKAWGRPVDVLILNDGSMLVSDDLSGTIYRITYQG